MIARLGAKLLGLSGPVLAWAAVAAGTVIAGLLLTVTLQFLVIQSKSEDIGAAEERARLATQTADGNRLAAVDLAERLTACVNENAISQRAEDEATAALERALADIDQTTEEERDARDDIYETDASCDAWRAALVCDRIAERLRKSAVRPGLGATGGGGGSGQEEDS